jgi:5-(carboxyamino)imidazole ribonucleotide mutase
MANKQSTAAKAAQVAVIMGSDSDLEAMKACMATMESLGITFSVTIASAHRTPKHLETTIRKFENNGGKVVIAAAGGAAHLAGVIAALTPLPVLGVPMRSPMLGLDSLLSMAQMPPGVPVAVVGVNGSKNAALFAAQILSHLDESVRDALIAFRKDQAAKVVAKSKKLDKLGWASYQA